MDQKHMAIPRDQFPVPRAQHPLPSVVLKVPRNTGYDASRSHVTHLNYLPVASGSDARLNVAASEKFWSDEEDDNAMESDMDEIPLDLLGVGTYDPRFDADGDFYGRGKDLFVGPTADPGEYVAKTFRLYASSFLHFSQYR